MLDYLQELDRSLFLFLNGMYSAFWDNIMYQATKAVLWTPVYLLFLYLVIRRYRWQTIIIIISVSLMITVSDQLSNLFKELVARPRPSHEPGLQVHLVNLYKGGTYGFYSAHASNFFSLAMFLIIFLRRYYRWFIIFVLSWASFVVYTRIYLGVHYPGDILAGTIVGFCLGYFFGRITFQLCLQTRDWFNQSEDS